MCTPLFIVAQRDAVMTIDSHRLRMDKRFKSQSASRNERNSLSLPQARVFGNPRRRAGAGFVTPPAGAELTAKRRSDGGALSPERIGRP